MFAKTPLSAGQRVKLTDDGPVMVVERVNPCAAYVSVAKLRHVVLRDDEGNVKREFDAKETAVLAISVNSLILEA